MYEVELKLQADHDAVRSRLETLDADHVDSRRQVDTYYNAPHREFAEKEPGDTASGALDEAVQALQSYDEIELSAEDIRSAIKDMIAQSKGEHEDDDEEDEEKTDGEATADTEVNTAKAANAANAGASTTATAKGANGSSGHSGLPSYGDAAAKYEGGN